MIWKKEECHVGKNIELKIWKILKSKTDSDVNMKQDLFEFGFELHLSDGFVKQKKTITLIKHTCFFYIHHLKMNMLDEQKIFLYKTLF